MKMFNFINFSPLVFRLSFLAFCTLFVTSCGEEVIKLNANDRIAIDTLSTHAIAKLTPELEKQCKDSSDALRKKIVDSLVVVREREIIMQTLPPNH